MENIIFCAVRDVEGMCDEEEAMINDILKLLSIIYIRK